MAITIQEESKLFSIHTRTTTYQFKADENGYLVHTYYGSRIEDDDLYQQIPFVDRGFSPNPYELGMEDRTYSMDTLMQEYSTYGTGDFRITALRVRNVCGSQAATLKYVDYEVKSGLPVIPGLPAIYGNEGETLIVRLLDECLGLEAYIYYAVLEDKDMIARSVRFVNQSNETVWLEKCASMCLDLPYGAYDFITFYGRHNMERNLSRSPIEHGISEVGSVRGTSSHQYNPFAMIAEKYTTEEMGRCYGFALAYSGDFAMEVEKSQTDSIRFLCGIHPDEFTWRLDPGKNFDTPQVLMSFSGNGFAELSYHFHQTICENIIRGEWKNKKSPVLINNWEATFFDFDKEKLIQIADAAKKLGVSLFVLDDGWFGKRDSDREGLGDWFPNVNKLGGMLDSLGQCIEDKGMKFGLWFEPEAISEESELFRSHPDWAFSIPGRNPALGRSQLILDLSRDDVVDYLTERLREILSSGKISYVKWDMNRSICDKYSRVLPVEQQGEVAHRYVLGLYRILERLTEEFPEILFEGCSGGGGRFDVGMLYYCPQIWCSDNTDAINRLKIQYGTSFCYPPRTMGAHVSESPNQQTGRRSSLKTRAVVAMAGTFGYELDVSRLSNEECAEIQRQVEFLKNYENLLFHGRYYRLSSPEDRFVAWEFASADKSEALVSVVYYDVEGNQPPSYTRVRGVSPDRRYRVYETGWNGENSFSYVLSGKTLEHAGILLPTPTYEGEAFLIRIEAL